MGGCRLMWTQIGHTELRLDLWLEDSFKASFLIFTSAEKKNYKNVMVIDTIGALLCYSENRACLSFG